MCEKQCFGSGFIVSGSGSSISGWISIRVRIHGFDDKNFFNKLQLNIFLDFFFIKNCKLLIPRTFKLQEKPSALKIEHSALQNIKFRNLIYFCGSFCPSGSGTGFRSLIRIHWPDWIRIHPGSETLVEREDEREHKVGVRSTRQHLYIGTPHGTLPDEVQTSAKLWIIFAGTGFTSTYTEFAFGDSTCYKKVILKFLLPFHFRKVQMLRCQYFLYVNRLNSDVLKIMVFCLDEFCNFKTEKW